MEKKLLGWPISVEVTDRFRDFCDDIGMEYGRSLEAAMALWPHIPPTLQRLAGIESGGLAKLDDEFWKECCRGLEDAIVGRVDNRSDKPKKK